MNRSSYWNTINGERKKHEKTRTSGREKEAAAIQLRSPRFQRRISTSSNAIPVDSVQLRPTTLGKSARGIFNYGSVSIGTDDLYNAIHRDTDPRFPYQCTR